MSKLPGDRSRVVLTQALVLVVSGIAVAGQDKGSRSKFEPSQGKTLVAVGAVLRENVEGYKKATSHTPQGAKIYCGLNGDGDVEHFKRNAQAVPEGGFLVVEYALDPAFPKESPKEADKLSAFLRGEKDAGIEAMGRAIKEYGRPVFADFGYEFDGQHPHQAREYAAVFRRIHDAWDRLGVRNVAYVWHSYTDNLNGFLPERNKTEAQIYEYYPGDDYVDWFGVSLYYDTQRQGAIRFARMARAKGKPLAIIESGVGVNPKKFWNYSWAGYYAPLFRTVGELDIKLLCYNNFGDDFNKFSEPGDPFRNTQMDRMPKEVREGWGRMMRTSRFRASITDNATKSDTVGKDGPGKHPSAGSRADPSTSGELLFNGKDLTGWTAYLKNGDAEPEDEYVVTSKGVLALKGRHEGYLRTETPHQDFVLTLDWRFPRGGRQTGSGSGVLLGLGGEDGWLSQGFEVQVASRNCGDLWAYEGHRFDGQHSEGRFGRVPKKVGAEKPPGEWNTYEIRCEGKKIVVELNGKVVNQGTSDRPINGRIGLISQGTEVEFRDIRVRSVAPGR